MILVILYRDSPNGDPKFMKPPYSMYYLPHTGYCISNMIYHMGGSINRGPQNRPKYTMIAIIGTTKMGPRVLGYQAPKFWKPPFGSSQIRSPPGLEPPVFRPNQVPTVRREVFRGSSSKGALQNTSSQPRAFQSLKEQ